MARTPAWKGELEQRQWLDLYLPADSFKPFLEEEQGNVRKLLTEAALVK
jgi:tripartite-type tricarboxylate transporter receptor subunit TctC